LYSYDFPTDQFLHWGEAITARVGPIITDAGIVMAASNKNPCCGKLIGVDESGNSYFSFRDNDNELWIIRYAKAKQIMGVIPAEWAVNLFTFSLAPDGTLYSLIYNPRDQTVPPKIIKCNFR
jgi:hypothetical protein